MGELRQTRDRIVEIIEARAGDLVPNPRNWRTHPEAQRRGLESLLSTVGSVDVLKAVRLPDGRLQLVDGHLRAEVRRDEVVRVAVLDLTQDEADLMLATFDPVSAMAGADLDVLKALLDDVRLEVPVDVLEQLDALVRGDSGGDSGKDDPKKDLYTKKITAPIYEPKGEKPEVKDLFDYERTKRILDRIEKSDLPRSEKEFLKLAAHRHTVFNYHRIADYYAHSSPEVQRMMEDSALVIIDFERAIELGYVKVTEEVDAYRKELLEEAS